MNSPQVVPSTSTQNGFTYIGRWHPGTEPAVFAPEEIKRVVERPRDPIYVVTRGPGTGVGVGVGGDIVAGTSASDQDCFVLGVLSALYPEWLGERSFCEAHGVRFPYVAGEMATGIATTELVIAMARAEMLGFFGAAGLDLARVEHAVDELVAKLGNRPNWGVNLIHSPNEPVLEERVVDLFLRRGVARVSASAFMQLTPPVVRYAATGLRVDRTGRVLRRNHLFAKVSQPEVATRFMSPAPPELLRVLVAQGQLTETEAQLAARVPVAEDVTVEADSGGHTDNRPLVSLLPVILGLRDRLSRQFGYDQPIRVGAAGGLGTPHGVAAAFGLGAAYVLTGSVNQCAVEAGISDDAKAMLAQAELADVTMAPAADMFELGVRVQVLKRGTMFAARAASLYEIYRTYPGLEQVPTQVKVKLEREILRAPVDEVWAETRRFWQRRDPDELTRADSDPKHRMALVFRWYLGKASRWAIEGEQSRRADYQVWCGPAMGAFNRWAAGGFLAEPMNRSVVQIAHNLLEGAAVITRAHQLRTYGVPVPADALAFTSRRLV